MQQAENKKHMDPQRMANRKQREAAPTQPKASSKAPEMPVRRALHNQTLDLNCVIAVLFYHGARMLACLCATSSAEVFGHFVVQLFG